jgi:hypothetical protein
MANELTAKKNEIVVYRPNETLRLDVNVENETVWLTQAQMVKLFERDQSVIARHIRNAFKEGEVSRESNMHFLHNAISDKPVQCYDLDVIISVGYRVKSLRGTQFRRWATQVLKDHLLKGYSVNTRLNQLEDKVDRRLAKHDQDIVELKEKVDFFVQTSLPPVQGVFFNGQVFDAHVFAAKYILNARKSILLIDSWVDLATLELLSKKNKGVFVEIVTSPRGNRLKTSDINAFNAQYGGLTVKTSKNFHDRFLIIDNKRLFLFGASLKDLGWKCFAFTELNASAIPELKARV